ncbi:50S ribosomal protein L18 [candidate division KSB1 bacterium]|nr:50S ribosomal protein L18 [candidate division KSB1 bacterium]RQW04916.1 MAG: 50S ribosomal protein L18 [candidate division KSB1 bacterium]
MVDKNSQKEQARTRRRKHLYKRIRGTQERPRLVVFRSNKEIYGQIIDDVKRETLAAASTRSKDIAKEIAGAKNKTERAKVAGKLLGELAKSKKIENVVFDRAGYLYHGRVKAFADGAREGGLKF